MRVELDFPSDEIDRFVEYVFADQLPFVQSVALNDTAKDFQAAERERMGDIFTLRRKRFAEWSVKIKPWAKKYRREVRISIDSPGGRSDIFTKFESDTIKAPFDGGSIAVPTEEVPRTGTGVIKAAWRPRRLFGSGSGSRTSVRSRGNVIRGARSTYLVRSSSGRGTIFRYVPGRRGRDGPGIPLYFLVPRVTIDPNLEFVDTAQKTINERWVPNFTRAFDFALRTAR